MDKVFRVGGAQRCLVALSWRGGSSVDVLTKSIVKGASIRRIRIGAVVRTEMVRVE